MFVNQNHFIKTNEIKIVNHRPLGAGTSVSKLAAGGCFFCPFSSIFAGERARRRDKTWNPRPSTETVNGRTEVARDRQSTDTAAASKRQALVVSPHSLPPSILPPPNTHLPIGKLRSYIHTCLNFSVKLFVLQPADRVAPA